MREKKRFTTKIGVGSVVKENVGDIEENTREGGNRSIRKEVVGYLQDMLGKKRLLVKFRYAKKKDMSDPPPQVHHDIICCYN